MRSRHILNRESLLRQLVRVREGEVEIGNGAMGGDLVGFVHIRHRAREEHSPVAPDHAVVRLQNRSARS